MARGKKTGGRNFAAGNTGRPKGSKNKCVSKAVVNSNQKEIEVIISKYMAMSIDKLKATVTRKTTKSLDVMVIKIIIECIKFGDFSRLNFLLDRTIGKVKDKLDVNNPDGKLAPQIIVSMPSNNREKNDE